MAVREATDRPSSGLAGEGLFIRKSSGLVRELGVRGVLGIGFGGLNLMGFFSGAAIFLQFFPRGDFYVPIVVGGVICGGLALAYAQLVGTFPRSGGEYVYASRLFPPVLGAAVGGAVLVAICMNCANSVVQVGQLYTQFAITSIGQAVHSHALQTFGTSTLGSKTAFLVLGILLVLFYMAVSLRAMHALARWILWTAMLGVAGFLLISVVLLFESHAGFVHAFNAASGGNAYQAIISKAHAGGLRTGIGADAVIALIPFGALIYYNFTYGNYTAGEIKRPLATYKVAVLSALVFTMLAALLAWVAMRHAVGLNFMQASGSLQANDPTTYAKLTSIPEVQGGAVYAIVAAGSPVLKVGISLGVLVAWIANGLAIFAVSSRIVFALSFDRLLPTKMADVREKSHAPVNAVIIVAMGVLAFTVLGTYTGFLTLFRNLVLVVTGILVIGSLCCAALPYRRPELFEASPKAIRGTLAGIPMVTIVGALAGGLFAAVDVDLATKSAYTGGYSAGSIVTIVAMATVGLALYAVSRVVNARRGVDMSLAMRELPPE